MRREIASALERHLKPQVRSRLVAIDMLLSGQPKEDAAACALVRPNTVTDWLRVVGRDGILPTLARWEGRRQPRPPQLDADAVALRELAAKEGNPRIRKRMLALACVAEGISPFAASVTAGLNHGAIIKRIKRFQQEGVAGIQDRKIVGRRHKLSSAQFQELRPEVLKHPTMSYGQFSELVWTRFRVRYSRASLARLLRNELGIVWNAGKFCVADTPTTPPPSQGDLFEHLQPNQPSRRPPRRKKPNPAP